MSVEYPEYPNCFKFTYDKNVQDSFEMCISKIQEVANTKRILLVDKLIKISTIENDVIKQLYSSGKLENCDDVNLSYIIGHYAKILEILKKLGTNIRLDETREKYNEIFKEITHVIENLTTLRRKIVDESLTKAVAAAKAAKAKKAQDSTRSSHYKIYTHNRTVKNSVEHKSIDKKFIDELEQILRHKRNPFSKENAEKPEFMINAREECRRAKEIHNNIQTKLDEYLYPEKESTLISDEPLHCPRSSPRSRGQTNTTPSKSRPSKNKKRTSRSPNKLLRSQSIGVLDRARTRRLSRTKQLRKLRSTSNPK